MPLEDAISQLQSWNLHVFMRRTAGKDSHERSSEILPSDVIFLEPPLAVICFNGSKIKEARVAAAHEGIAEMVVTIEYDNGGKLASPLDHCRRCAIDQRHAKTLAD